MKPVKTGLLTLLTASLAFANSARAQGPAADPIRVIYYDAYSVPVAIYDTDNPSRRDEAILKLTGNTRDLALYRELLVAQKSSEYLEAMDAYKKSLEGCHISSEEMAGISTSGRLAITFRNELYEDIDVDFPEIQKLPDGQIEVKAAKDRLGELGEISQMTGLTDAKDEVIEVLRLHAQANRRLCSKSVPQKAVAGELRKSLPDASAGAPIVRSSDASSARGAI